MRRSVVTGVALLLAGVLMMLGGAPASAVEPPPPPVAPVDGLPSTYTKSVFTGSGLADDQIKFAAWMLQQRRAREAAMAAARAGTAAPVAEAVAEGKAITQARPFVRGAAGGALSAAFMGGWMITDGTLAMYAHVTGSNPLQNSCQWGDFGVAAIEVLYPFSSPDCSITVDNPNADSGSTTTITVAGTTATFKGFVNIGQLWGYHIASCWTGWAPTGYSMVRQYAGSSTWWGMTTTGAYYGACTGAYAGSTNAVQDGSYQNSTGVESQKSTNFGMRNNTTQVVTPATVVQANPNRVPKCDLKWPDGSTTTATGAPYQESAGLPLSTMNTMCNDAYVSKPGHGPSLLPSEIKIGSLNPDTGTTTEIQKTPVPEYSPEEIIGLEPGWTGGGLVLRQVIGTVVGNCLTWEVDCAGWWSDTEEGTTTGTGTKEYRCTYNGVSVGLAECGVYRQTFETRTNTPRITDPQTGAEEDWVTAPESGSSPGSANSTSPGASISPGDACFASWPPFSLADPITWVMHPVYCAMVKAFVPRQSVVDAHLGTIEGRWANTAPGALATAVTAWSFVAPSSSGCNGITVGLSELGHGVEDFEILNACAGEPLAPLAALSTLVIGIGAVLTAIRGVTGAVGGIVGARALGGGSES